MRSPKGVNLQQSVTVTNTVRTGAIVRSSRGGFSGGRKRIVFQSKNDAGEVGAGGRWVGWHGAAGNHNLLREHPIEEPLCLFLKRHHQATAAQPIIEAGWAETPPVSLYYVRRKNGNNSWWLLIYALLSLCTNKYSVLLIIAFTVHEALRGSIILSYCLSCVQRRNCELPHCIKAKISNSGEQSSRGGKGLWTASAVLKPWS